MYPGDWNGQSVMHELPITEGIRALALETAQQGVRRIIAVDLVVGELSSIVDDRSSSTSMC